MNTDLIRFPMNRMIIAALLTLTVCIGRVGAVERFDMADFGVVPGGKNLSAKVTKALEHIRAEARGDSLVICFRPGRYDFHPEGAARRMYYISNHAEYRGGQAPLERPVAVALPLEDFKGLTVEGNGALFVCHGCMLPVSLVRSEGCTLRDFAIDFQESCFPSARILKNEGRAGGITFEPFPDARWRLSPDSVFEAYAQGEWGSRPFYATVYEAGTGRVAYNTGDVDFPNHALVAQGTRAIRAPHWQDKRLKPGHILLLRTWDRPAPGIFLHDNTDTSLRNLKIHHAGGMGVLAQLCTDVTLDSLQVRLSGRDSLRHITTIADATHFVQCSGRISSTNGYYERMGDDAINVHGVYLRVDRRLDDRTVAGRFMYEQTYGFEWGTAGDTVQFVRRETSEACGGVRRIVSVTPMDGAGTTDGAHLLRIVFDRPLDEAVTGGDAWCMENLTRTPEVCFARNTVRDNRARGALFTTPRRVVVEDNVFDHVSGSAILISGDCSYWYESGACRDVLIRGNRFVNVLSSPAMECHAVISIAPLVGNLTAQRQSYHGSIRIVGNRFDVFDAPVVFARSVEQLLFRDNVIHTNTEYPPYHENRSRFRLEKVGKADIE